MNHSLNQSKVNEKIERSIKPPYQVIPFLKSLHFKQFSKVSVLTVVMFLVFFQPLSAQKKIENQLADSLSVFVNKFTWVGKLTVTDLEIKTDEAKVVVKVNERLAYMPMRPDNVVQIYKLIRSVLPSKYARYELSCVVDGKTIEDLIPAFYKTERKDTAKWSLNPSATWPMVTNLSRPFVIDKGLENRHIALWQSHGWHYDQRLARWEWQRARIFQIVEDLYTQSYVLPYLVPMLENAGANVLIPRERDTQIHEIIIDNDIRNKESRYREHNDRKSWRKSDSVGFANTQKEYLQGQNPFRMGTARQIAAVSDLDETSRAEWFPTIPESGRYAVYVSYQTVANSAPDAHYTVFHKGGQTDFRVNQTMNGGTWLYLGHFEFDKGRSNKARVLLSNYSTVDDAVITADAVKIGGGMGNMARCQNVDGISPNAKSSDSTMVNKTVLQPQRIYEPEISRYPRFTEAARYWMQWAGVPDSIYSKSAGKNDYTDDYQSRGHWVNYLAGGSAVAPNSKGLNVPIDLAFAFHTDAGTTYNDSIIGTLGICTTQNSDGKSVYLSNLSRWSSRDLTDIVQTQIVNDIRSLYAPEWVRRGIWNKSYNESRVPEVPTMLLELLSHQNFADMRYGLDPRFQFSVSRSIYKGMLKFLCSLYNTDYVVQPLPVESFSCRFADQTKLELRWLSVPDSLEPTAIAQKFVLYTRIDDGAFNQGEVVNSNRVILDIVPGKQYSFKITALNEGGESFPSEILSAYRAPSERGEILIVNAFDRISAPGSLEVDSTFAGFMTDKDAGVPYISDITFIGKQFEFDRRKPWLDDDAPGFGASNANYETQVIAGNSFDYPYVHGQSIKTAGYSFVSCSKKSVLTNDVDMNRYKVVDLILGKQKQTFIGNGKKAAEFKTFPLALQQSIQSFCQQGGSLLVSGAFLASDLCEGQHVVPQDKQFVEDVLKCKFRASQACVEGNVREVSSANLFFTNKSYTYFDKPNAISYYVESSDAIEPIDDKEATICRYSENNLSAAVAFDGKYKLCAFGFPIESIKTETERNQLFESVLTFFFR